MARIKPQALLQQSKKKKTPRNISVPAVALYSVVDDVVVSESKKSDVPGYAIFNTSKGLITVELYKEGSPEIVDAFIDACTKQDKDGFDIFITTVPIPDLNAKLNVFGRVIKGEDVVQVKPIL
ncbi:peptidyl-prolyl cis-trans isomerase CYP21-4-like [Bidens hawaiensis]|uniref:peptidyl-prolyl cis-trans isomerase CYP21-4-like n=1 Tax=Bidens hawaiensis TaxID=980011 RepID=UPI00404AC4CC